MKIDVISVQPQMLEGFLTESILGRAVKKGACEINIVDLRAFGEGRWRKVDDKPYGGGPGMLMKCGPWFAAVESCLSPVDAYPPRTREAVSRAAEGRVSHRVSESDEDMRRETRDATVGLAPRASRNGTRIIMTSPKGRRFTQRDAEFFAGLSKLSAETAQSNNQTIKQSNNSLPHLIFLCGHYEGFDARIETLATDIFSVGDFVMTGGELAAAAMVDSIVRLLPGVLGGGPAATSSESFSLRGSTQPSTLNAQLLLEPPQYTHPPEFRGMKVPEVLLSGDHAKIEAWRACEALRLTERLRPDLINRIK